METEMMSSASPMPQRREYGAIDCAFAWMAMAAGYLFCRVVPLFMHPLGGFVFILLLYAATVILLSIRKAPLNAASLTAAASAVAVSGTFILCDNAFLHFFAYLYALWTYLYFIYSALGNGVGKVFANAAALDFLRALVVPFYSIGELFYGMFSGKAKSGGKVLVKVLCGVAITVIPTSAVLSLLSYDSGFSQLLSDIVDIEIGDVFSHLFSLLFGIPVGTYVFGAFVASAEHKGNNLLTAEQCSACSEKLRVLPLLTTVAATLPLLFVYVVFFLSQWQYYVSAFTGVLPQELSYADYARDGFFQLCAVAVINLVVMISLVLLTKQDGKQSTVLVRAIAVVLSVFTLVLIATAVSKMVLYIDSYGLTPKRVYATWFMGVLAVVFVLTIVRQFVKKLPCLAASAVVCVVMFAALGLSGTDAFIAQYNVDRYLEGTLTTVDFEAMSDLGDAAIPALVDFKEALEEQAENNTITRKNERMLNKTATFLAERKARLADDDSGVWGYTLPTYRAKKALGLI